MPIEILFLLTPFFIYFLAEEIHVSGIIAVVAAGLVHNMESERSRLTNAAIFYNSKQISQLLTDILNGIVFIVLGIIIVRSMREVSLINKQLKHYNWYNSVSCQFNS